MKVDWQRAEDIEMRVRHLVNVLELNWVDCNRIYAFRSSNSKARAYARIWGFGRIWQKALDTPACYCIEVLSQHFDKQSEDSRDKILLHEIAHIPRNFSGSLLPHTRRGKGSFHKRLQQMEAAYRNI